MKVTRYHTGRTLEIFDLKGKSSGFEERKKFYSEIKKEYKKTGKVTMQVKGIRLLLMNSEGRIYLQKRNRKKAENPGLFDKTIGGHVARGDSFKMTIVRECAEELEFPAAVLSKEEFEKAKHVTDVGVIGIFKLIETINCFESTRLVRNRQKFIQPHITAIYTGYYNGAIKFIDGETTGIEIFSLEELKEDMKNEPHKFTEDIKWMVREYERYLRPI